MRGKGMLMLAVLVLVAGMACAEGTVRLPRRTEIVGEEAFLGTAASAAVLPEGVRRIEARAFAFSRLQSVSLPSTLEYIAEDAFEGCEELSATRAGNAYAEDWCARHGIPVRRSSVSYTVPSRPRSPAAEILEDCRVKLTWQGTGESAFYAVYEVTGGVELLLQVVRESETVLSGLGSGENTFLIRAGSNPDDLASQSTGSERVTVSLQGSAWDQAPQLTCVEETAPGRLHLTWTGGAGSYEVVELDADGTLRVVAEVSGLETELENVSTQWHTYAVRAVLPDGKRAMSRESGLEVAGSASEIRLSETRFSLYEGESLQVETVILPANTPDRQLTAVSSDPSVASVSVSRGTVTVRALAAGQARVTVACGGGAGAACEVEVLSASPVVTGDYTVTKGVLTGYSGTETRVVIPDDLGIREIGSAFKGNRRITELVLPEGVTRVLGSAFSGMTGLVSCSMPDTVTEVGSSLFSGDYSLTSCRLSESLTEIPESMFSRTTSLLSIHLPESVTRIGPSAFSSSGIVSVSFPEGLVYLGHSAFRYCNSLTEALLPDSVTYMGGWVFDCCKSLKRVHIPCLLPLIYGYAFNECYALEELELPSGITEIGDHAFAMCQKVGSLQLPDGLKTIGGSAFRGWSITRLDLPDSVTSLGAGAFESCQELTDVHLGTGIRAIPYQAFQGCTKLESLVIPEGVTSIGYHAFGDCTALVSLRVPDSVMAFDTGAFSRCTNLISVHIPFGVTELPSSVFSDCKSLQAPRIPDSVKTIDGFAFSGCTFSSIDLPDSVTVIGNYAFSGCRNLGSLVLPRGLKVIEDCVLENCSGLVSMTVPYGATKIEQNAFYGCSGLRSCVIPPTVTTINRNAFQHCKDVTIYGESGSAAETFASAQGMPFVPMTVTPDTAGSGEKDPDGITLNADAAVLHPGERFVLSASAQGGRELPYRFESSREDVAQVLTPSGAVTALRLGRTSVKVTSYNGKTAVCPVTVLPEGYTLEDEEALMARLDNEYQWLVFLGSFLKGGGRDPGGVYQEGIQLEKITKDWIQTAYANVFGYSAGTTEGILSQAYTLADRIMCGLSDVDEPQYISTDFFDKCLKYTGIGEDTVNAIQRVMFDRDRRDGKLKIPSYWSEKAVDEYFDRTYKLELEALTVAGDASSMLNSVATVLKKAYVYMNVKSEDVQVFIDVFSASDSVVLKAAAVMLEDFRTEEGIVTHLALEGVKKPAERWATRKIRGVLGKSAKQLVEACGPVGAFLKGAAIGKAVGVTFNNTVMNINAIQKAAFQAQYAINAAASAQKSFTEAYNLFKSNELDLERFEALAEAYIVYREMLSEAYEAYAKIPGAIDDSMAGKLARLITDCGYEKAADSAAGMATMARTMMHYDLTVYGQDFWPGSPLSAQLSEAGER